LWSRRQRATRADNSAKAVPTPNEEFISGRKNFQREVRGSLELELGVSESFRWPRIMNTIISGHNRKTANDSTPLKGMPNVATAANRAMGTMQHRSINHMCQPEPWL
jgi:hypothetical protein